jgi:hypothetical protein
MCYFISVAVPKQSVDSFAALIPAELAIHESQNVSLGTAIPDGWKLFVLTQGPCSCGLFVGESEVESTEQAWERLRRKFEKKKWSRPKIDRAIESSLTDREKTTRSLGFADIVREVVADFAAGYGSITIIAHWYGGDVDSESVVVNGTSSVSGSKFRKGDFGANADLLIHVLPDEESKVRRT